MCQNCLCKGCFKQFFLHSTSALCHIVIYPLLMIAKIWRRLFIIIKGANGLANPYDFLSPKACFVDETYEDGFQIIDKYQGHLFYATQVFSCKHL